MAHAAAGRFGLKAKLVVVSVALLAVAATLVLTFAAGFATSAVLSETGARDRCSEIGTWDAERMLCTTAAPAAQQQMAPEAGDRYTCGDGGSFTLSVSSSSALLVSAGTEHNLPVVAGSAGNYDNGVMAVAVSGPEARFEDRARGIETLCEREA